MTRQRPTSSIAAITFLFLAAGGPSFAQSPPPPDVPPTRSDATVITGTLELNGCVVDPADVVLRARPYTAGALMGARLSGDVRLPAVQLPDRVARIEAAEAHTFRFVIDGLAPSQLYRIGVRLPPNPCGRVFWRGPARGLVPSGSADVSIEGFAARTTVDVKDARTGNWLGLDDLRFDNPAAATRTVRWRSTLDDVVGGELQIAFDPFPVKGRFGACDEPPEGLLHRERVPARRGSGSVTIDFGAILSPTRSATGRVTPTLHRRLLAGHPVYVRVVPLRADGPACNAREDGVPGWVILSKVPHEVLAPLPQLPVPRPLSADAGQTYVPPYVGGEVGGPGWGHPTFNEIAYRVIRPHLLPPADQCTYTGSGMPPALLSDPLGCTMVQVGFTSGTVLLPGQWFYFMPQSSGGDSGDPFSDVVDSFSNFVTGFAGAFGQFVNFLHAVTEEVKTAVAQVVVDVVEQLPGNPCTAVGTDTCVSFAKTGIEIGLSSMGLPPSIPNWDQVKDQGVDYLAAEIASETGAPEELTEHALEVAKAAIEKMTEQRGGTGPQYDWVIPYNGFDPAVWTITIRKQTLTTYPNLVLVRSQNSVYAGAQLPIPTVFPTSDVLTVPMVLPPNVLSLAPPLCVADAFGAVTCSPAFLSQPACYFKEYVPFQGVKTMLVPCSATNWPDVYYRDRWTMNRYLFAGCANLVGASFYSAPFSQFPWPKPPFFDLGRLRPQEFATWDGMFYAGPGCQ